MPTQDSAPAPRKRGFLRWLSAIAAALFTLQTLKLAFATSATVAVGTGGLLWYTSRPQFCTSCHNMQPYYDSWEHSKHKDVTCVACHFPPGVDGFILGKMAALSQLAQYFTGTEGPKPFAHMTDASCLRSGCHAVENFKPTEPNPAFKSKFNHEAHLKLRDSGGNAFLSCAGCHTQIFRDEHMTLNKTACALCHMRPDAPESRSKCTTCHNVPGPLKVEGGTFEHSRLEKNSVGCASCHAGLTEGTGRATKQRCLQCHNSKETIEQFNNVEMLHRDHVLKYTVSCMDCHLDIRHQLEPEWVGTATSCETCHPNHHSNQRQMLSGAPGHGTDPQKNPMFKIRAGCLACHISVKHAGGEVVLAADAAACEQCHDKGFGEMLDGWKTLGAERASELAEKVAETRKKLEAYAGDLKVKADAEQKLKKIEANLSFVQLGKPAHNFSYAEAIFDSAEKELTAVEAMLK
ncbi:MAG: NapC/NirT family cytochrome c [Planctomycetes bacterium]|nr:NapC/NirT family cytochrome c [Planctomycetota bacterium]